MSKPMKLIAGLGGVLVLAAVVLTMFGKPPNLPLGPLQGMLAKDEDAITATDAGLGTDPGLGSAVECADAGALGSTDPAAGGGAIDPATGQPVDPAAGATDPAAGGAIDPATGQPIDPAAGATDPATGAPVAAPGEGWSGDARVSAASAGSYDASRVSDTRIVAADAIDPATGLPADPAATDPSGGQSIDPATGQPTDPAATDPAATDPAATDPAATGTDPAAGGLVDPCATDPTAGGLTDPAAGGATDPAASGAGAGAGATGAGANGGNGAAAAASKSTTDGSSTGNSPEALRAAKDATNVMQKAKITVTTTATLVPSAGGIGRAAAVKRYRRGVTAAVLVMKLDTSAQQQWTGAGKKVQTDLVKSFITRLGKSYPKASRSITIVDSTGNVLAFGDAAPRARASVKLF